MLRLEGKKAVVTGGARGLGEALVVRLANEGCDVACWDIDLEGAQETARKAADQTGRETTALRVDVSDADDVRNAMEQTAEALGGLDVCVANAGICISGSSLDFKAADWRKVVEVNLVGYFLCAREAIRIMLEKGGGSIVQINSKSGKLGSFKNTAYAASKFGGIGLTQSLALEFAEQGIRINAVCPGNLLDSPLWVNVLYKQYAKNKGITEEEVRQLYVNKVPMKRGCQYSDVANVVVFLASEESSYMTGQAINVTGGQEMR